LNWCRDLVMCEIDVLEEMVIERRVGEFQDWLGDIVAGSFDWNIVVLLEVDTGLLFGWVISYAKQLSLETWVGWSSNMLSVTPLPIASAASGRRSRATTSCRVAICISVEGGVLSSGIPAWASCGSSAVATRSEVRSAGPVSTGTGASVTSGEAVSAWVSTLACHQ
jgi:hypothetical protein